MELLVITPSRGRPARLAEMVEAVAATRWLDTHVLAFVDDDDPTLAGYAELAESRTDILTVRRGRRRSLTGWTNRAALEHALADDPTLFLASLGDDHLPRTPGWDAELVGEIGKMDGPGWAYGNDLLQGERIPTAWVQSTQLVKALGWMALPCCEHLCIDSAVYDLGHAAGRIAYRQDIVVEHMHPAVRKAPTDGTYREGNSAERNELDGAAYHAWLGEGFERDAATVRALTWSHAHVEA